MTVLTVRSMSNTLCVGGGDESGENNECGENDGV